MSRRQTAFGIAPAGALIGNRLELIEEAWLRLSHVYGVTDNEPLGADKVPLNVIVRHYDANRHPLHVRGWTSKGRLHDVFVSSFKQVSFRQSASEGENNNTNKVVEYVSRDSFIDFYVKLSMEVQVMRQKGEAALDPDVFFCEMVSATWHLDDHWGGSDSRDNNDDDDDDVDLSSTSKKNTKGGSGMNQTKKNLSNSNDEDVLRPTGIKSNEPISRTASAAMDLVWLNTQDQLVGFHGIVQPLFPRIQIPAELRGHFALGVESQHHGTKYLPTRPTNQPPLDFVWKDKETEQMVGFQGIVASSVDMPVVPPEMKQHLYSPAQSRAANVEFIPCAKPAGPVLFRKMNDDYGLDAVTEARRVAALKKAVFEGTACGNVYATTWSGKFSDQFPAGPYRQAGLNTSASKPRFELGSWKTRK